MTELRVYKTEASSRAAARPRVMLSVRRLREQGTAIGGNVTVASTGLSADRWRRFAKACEGIGMTAFACLFTARLILFFYYIWDRPVGAQPGLAWTIHLGWGRYGSVREASNLSSLMWWGAIAFAIIFIGGAIRVYKLGENVFGKTKQF